MKTFDWNFSNDCRMQENSEFVSKMLDERVLGHKEIIIRFCIRQFLRFVRQSFHHFEPRQLLAAEIGPTVALDVVVAVAGRFEIFANLTNEIFVSVASC